MSASDHSESMLRVTAWAGRCAEALQGLGLPVVSFQTTNASKAGIIEGLVLAFEQGRIRILPDPDLIDELQAFELSTLPSGAIRYAAPSGMHDDMVMSLALAWNGIGRGIDCVYVSW